MGMPVVATPKAHESQYMPTFILGAGFNVDAVAEAGPIFGESLYLGRYQIKCGYPLVCDTIRLCFGLDAIPEGKSIEDLFSDAVKGGDYGPIRKLADLLREADYYIARRIASDGEPNCYRNFFGAFAESNFLTFNYDSLPETFLFRRSRWYPHDGYGLRVSARVLRGTHGFEGMKSSALVLHLHGSLCIRTSEYEPLREPGNAMPMLTERDEPLYAFDPSSISANFTPFVREAGSDDVEDRIIAPIPDKSGGLRDAFIGGTYAKAVALVRGSDSVVAIGYSFSPHDRTSFQPLLHALGESRSRRLLVVAPDAGDIADAIRPAFPQLDIKATEATFRQWVDASFPGLA